MAYTLASIRYNYFASQSTGNKTFTLTLQNTALFKIRQSATSNTDLSCYQGSLSSRPSTSRSSMNKDRSRGQSVKRSSRSDTHSSANLFDPRLSADYKAIKDVFRKHWPPLWQVTDDSMYRGQ